MRMTDAARMRFIRMAQIHPFLLRLANGELEYKSPLSISTIFYQQVRETKNNGSAGSSSGHRIELHPDQGTRNKVKFKNGLQSP